MSAGGIAPLGSTVAVHALVSQVRPLSKDRFQIYAEVLGGDAINGAPPLPELLAAHAACRAAPELYAQLPSPPTWLVARSATPHLGLGVFLK
jgi:hypothetical protein